MDGGPVVAAVCGLLGALAGLLLARPAYRMSVPAGAAVRAACQGCSAALGWLAVRGCRGCGRRLGPPGWLLAGVAGLGCAGIGWRFGVTAGLLPYLLLVLLGVLLAAVDLACLRLPDGLVKPGFVVGAGVLTGVALAEWEWSSLVRAGVAAAVVAAGYLVLAIVPGGQLGYGDVKLAGLLGLFLGWLGWGEVLAGVTLPFLLNAVVTVALLATGRVGRKTLVPLGPAMLAGAWLAVVALPLLR